MVLTAASTNRILGSWALTPMDPNDQYGLDGHQIASRGEWLYDNDPIARAIVESILQNALGPCGLQFRSVYRADLDGKLTDADTAVRRKIERGIKAGTLDKRFDASGTMTRPTMSKVVMATMINDGIAFSVKESKPNRPGRPSHSTCWRLVHPLRVSNPGFVPNNWQYRDGFEIDSDKNPIAIHVQRTHPNTKWNLMQFIWDRVPLYDSEGWPNVTVHCQHRIADQLRPVGWFSPVMQLMRLFGRTVEAKVVADVLKASMGLIVESENPEQAAAADRNGAVLGPNTKITPGKVYYVRKGTTITPLNFDYKGEDFDKWQEVVLTNICAAFQVPMEFVLMRLTRSNMASSRVALAQAYRTFHAYQDDLIASTEGPWNDSLIREDLLRGRLGLPIPDELEGWDGILAARYLRPARHMPDPGKEAAAADLWVKRLGKSFSSIYAEAGLDFDDEIPQRQRDNQVLEDHGIELEVDALSGEGDSPSGAESEDEKQDKESEQADDQDDQDEAGEKDKSEHREPAEATA